MKMSLRKLEVKDMVNILDWGYDKALNGFLFGGKQLNAVRQDFSPV